MLSHPFLAKGSMLALLAVAGQQATAPPMVFVPIPAGTFTMGCSKADTLCEADESPAHLVRITKTFELGKYEVTQAQWQAVMGTNPSARKGDSSHPVDTVSWDDVQGYLTRMNASGDGYHYRLPTEAEWEYAARAGSSDAYPGTLDSIGWYGNNSGRAPFDADAVYAAGRGSFTQKLLENGGTAHPVGQKQPNAWGLHDMIGNVREWVQDWYGATSYKDSSEVDPAGPATGGARVMRSGSWTQYAAGLRVSRRASYASTTRNNAFGFRVVRVAATP